MKHINTWKPNIEQKKIIMNYISRRCSLAFFVPERFYFHKDYTKISVAPERKRIENVPDGILIYNTLLKEFTEKHLYEKSQRYKRTLRGQPS